MTTFARRGIPLYLAAMLVMAWTGSMHRDANLALRRADATIVELRDRIATLRVQASVVRGPAAVAAWATERGMVPAPDVDRVEHVMPFPAPLLEGSPTTGLEVTTSWR